jgi:glycosyltransferase involved in cell wall biosynthesis
MHLAVDGSGLARPWAGVATYTRYILGAMAAVRASRFTLFGPATGLEPPAIDPRPLPAIPLFGRHLLWPAALRRLGADAYFGPAGSLPLGGTGMPSVITAHDLAIYRHPEWFPGGQWLSVKVVVPRSLRRATAVIAVSNSTARDLEALFCLGSERVTVVHEGVAPGFQPLHPSEVGAHRARLGLPDRFVLFVGTIEPRKNLTTLVDAWERMRDRPELVIAGGWGWRHEEIRARLESAAGSVRVLGHMDPGELRALYGLATVLAHPAWYEGFGLTPLEAMACGTPVIASNAASLPEVVGDAAVVVDPADVEGWTEALDRVCRDEGLRAQLRKTGLSRAAEFTWGRAAEGTWSVFDRALARSAAEC